MRALPRDDPRVDEFRERVVAIYEPLIRKVARRYCGRGEPYEDLRQTGMLGLVKAINGYDPHRGKSFVSYLLPTATGEIKRHFRDHTWAVRVPRRHQEHRSHLHRVQGEYLQRHARTPTISELSKELGLPEEEVRELVMVSESYSTLSLDASNAQCDMNDTLEDRLGREDASLERVVERESLKPALSCLAPRERTILKLRFFDDHTQSEIADQVGCSQMHVSRLLAATLEKLREETGADA
jgi:RNA polymerase sigma-B factor